jgi:hypothetical protein
LIRITVLVADIVSKRVHMVAGIFILPKRLLINVLFVITELPKV